MSWRRGAGAVLWVLVGAGADAGQAVVPEADAVPGDSAGVLRLTVEEAVARGLRASQEVGVARLRARGARAEATVARSAILPQVEAQLGYTRTFRTVFEDVGLAIPDSLRFDPDPTDPLEERVSYLESAAPVAGVGALGSVLGDLPFGNENTWIAALTVSQPVFTAGRIGSGVAAAERAAEALETALEEVGAELALEVRRSYHDAALAGARVEIVEASVELARTHLEEVRLRREAGRASQLEALRAEVELENLRPALIRSRSAARLALLDLKRLLNVPPDTALVLATPLLPSSPAERVELLGRRYPPPGGAYELLERRASVRSGRAQVEAQRERVSVARAAFLPSVVLTATLSSQAFPSELQVPDDWRDDWTAGVQVQWPLFQGRRRSAELSVARAQEREAELRLEQVEESVRIGYERAIDELEAARAQVSAAGRVVEQAEEVYRLTELRFEEGLATNLDVSDARLALQQARINEVQAYRDARVAVAEVERALGIAATGVAR